MLLGFSLVFQVSLGFSSESSGRQSPGTNGTVFLLHSTHSYFRVLSTSGVCPPGRSGLFYPKLHSLLVNSVPTVSGTSPVTSPSCICTHRHGGFGVWNPWAS